MERTWDNKGLGETQGLPNSSPFDDQDILGLFGEKIKILNFIVNTVHSVVQVAA